MWNYKCRPYRKLRKSPRLQVQEKSFLTELQVVSMENRGIAKTLYGLTDEEINAIIPQNL